jgi:hypothetical protein
MSPFDPRDRDMSRPRSQVLFRYRPGQTFDHVGGYTAQVRQYGRDDAYQGYAIDPAYVVDEAMRFVRWWRLEGRAASGAEPGTDRAPEFPEDLPLAHQHYQVVIPGKVYCRVWPPVWRCARSTSCGLIWEAPDPRPGDEPWPPRCVRCGQVEGNRQLQFVFVHPCGQIEPMTPPGGCPRHHRAGFRLNDQASRFQDLRWECLECRLALPVQNFCPNRAGCRWTNKMMSPQVHTASSAYVGHGRTLVNVPREDFARLTRHPAFVVATVARWLEECTDEEARAAITGAAAAPEVPQAVLDSIRAMEAAGLTEQAEVLRRQFMPVDVDDLRRRVEKALGFDPLGEDERGRSLAANLAVFDRVLSLSRLAIADLRLTAPNPGRASRYDEYGPVLAGAGLAPERCMLINNFPVAYLAVGYSRGGFSPREADLVAYRGRADRGQAITNLLHVSPTETEALVFVLDRARVGRWLVANGVVTVEELREAGGPHRWFATRFDSQQGQMPTWDPESEPLPGDPEFGPRALFRLLHSLAHQMLRALAVDSGFSETAMSEYLFPYDLAFAIHPNGGSEFTIGGLRTVLEQNLDEVVQRALDTAACIYDPNCMVANRGADHGCLQLPETSCQAWNRFISRWDLFGAHDGRWLGYWDPILAET